MVDRKKILLSMVALVTLVTSIALTFGAFGNVQRGFAQNLSSVTASDFYVPSGSDPWGTAFDSSGRVWVALPGCDPAPICNSTTPPGKIAVFDPNTSSWGVYALPSGYAQPLFLAFDHQGMLWFPMPMSNSIGMFNPNTQTFQQWTVPTPGAGPWGVAVDSQGKVWFTEHYTNQIGSFDPGTSTFKEIATPATNSQPYGITVDASGNVWFTENNSAVALIGEYTTQGQLLEYKIRNGSTDGLTPHLITIDPNGNIWWSEGWATMIGELQISQAVAGTNNGVTEYAYKTVCSTCGAHTAGISVDSYGQVWFDDSLQSIYGSFPDTGTGQFTLYNTPTSNAHPHDGMNVDSQNRVWFTEEFARKLARVIQSVSVTPAPTASVSPTSTATVVSSPSPSPTVTVTPSPSLGGTLAQDTFQRKNQAFWGTASDGNKWAGDASTQSVFSISNNTGQVSSGSGIYNAVLGPTASDAEVLFNGSLNNFSGANLGAVLRWSDTNNWYKGYIDGTALVIQRKLNGSTTLLGSTPFAAKGGTSYTLRFRVIGTNLYAKVWQTSSTEPTSWMVTSTDTSLSSGFCGLRIQIQSGVIATVTSFQATAPGGSLTPTPSPTVMITPSPTVAVTPSPSPSVTVVSSPSPSPTSGTSLAQDTFQRPNQAQWGIASDGNTWSGDANTQSAFSISNNTGQVSNGNMSYSAVLGPSATNAEVLFSGSISSFSNTNLGAVLRWTDGNNWYKAFIDGNNLVIQKKVNGATTILALVPFAATGGTSYTLRFRAVGNTLYARAWQTGTTEPANWMITVADSTFTSGFCGLRVLVQSGAVATITSFRATLL